MSKSYLYANREFTDAPIPQILEMHTHDNYEIFVFFAGDALYHVEGTVYPLEAGDILIMKKAEAHSLWINRSIPYERVIIEFSADAIISDRKTLLLDFLDRRPLGLYNRYPATLFPHKKWNDYIRKIIEHRKDRSYVQLYLTVLLNELCEEFPTVQKNWHRHTNQIADIINYINNHYTKPLTVDALCQEFFISSTQLNRLFRNSTGVPVWRYITVKRLLHAKELIENGESSTSACSQCGFNDYSPFYRAYKAQFGVSPNKHKVKQREPAVR